MPKQNVPALRLEGFDGEWSQSTLGSFARKVNEKNVDLSVAETFTNSAERGVISQTEYFKHQVSNDTNLGGYYVVQPDDFIYNPRISTGAPVGPINRNKLERVGVVSPLYTVFRLSVIDHCFLDWFFKSPHWHGFMRENGDSGARGDRLSIGQELFFQMPVSCPPTFEEQQAIGAIFTNLDAAINQHTLKHKALQQSKTALMQRMFPQEGQTVPELRLEGFDGEWCIKSLDELATVKSAARVHREQWRDSGVPFFRASDVSAVVNGVKNEKAFISHELYEELSAKSGKLRKGDLLVIGGGSIGTTYQVPNDGPLYSKDADVLWVQPNANVSSDYLETFFGSLLFEKYLKSISHAGTIAHYTIIQAKRTLVPTPPTLAEQQAIGAVFTNLDQLIVAEARYIKSLKQAKTALLQRMFI